MIPQNRRLPLSGESHFPGKRLFGQYVSVVQGSSSLSHYRLAIIVSKKISKFAVRRNQLRRLLAATAIKTLAGAPPFDWLIVAKPKAIQATATEIRFDLETVISESF
jgi:ribonuclease P protein component